MRYTIHIPQAGLAAADLLGRVSIEALIALGAAARFFLSSKSTRLKADDGADYVWLDANHLLTELPILWPAKPDKTRRNCLSRALRELIAAELLQTRRGARGRLFVRLTELALSLETIHRPEKWDDTIPASRDGENAASIYRTKGSEPCDGASDFSAFWTAYPKKRDRLKAMRAWNATRTTRPALDVVLAALEQFRVSADWTKEDGRFIPHASSWLNGERWTETESERPSPEISAKPTEPYPTWREELAQRWPGCYVPATWEDLGREHPDIADQLLAGPRAWREIFLSIQPGPQLPDSWTWRDLNVTAPELAREICAIAYSQAAQEAAA